jgi:CO dehydrogenase maturation factor
LRELSVERGFKIAVCGKGGVGKTLIAGTMARLLAKRGFKVLAIDVDSNPNLYSVLGIRLDTPLRPIVDREELIEERTGAKPGGWGLFFTLNPRVDDIPDKYSLISHEGIKLLTVGIPRAGLGCMCPQNALVKALIDHIVLDRSEIVILDMEAGLEHFGRGTARGVDYLLIIIEPTIKSLETAKRSLLLARELGISRVWCILNKVKSSEEADYIIKKAIEMNLQVKAFIPYDINVVTAELLGVSIFDYNKNSPFILAIDKLCQYLLNDWYKGK